MIRLAGCVCSLRPMTGGKCWLGRQLPQMTRLSRLAATKAAPPKRSDLLRLLGVAKPERWRLAGAVGLLFVSSGVTMAVPFCLGKVIDLIYSSDHSDTKRRLTQLCTVLCGVFALGAACNFGRVYLMSIAGQRVTRRLRQAVFAAALRQEAGYFASRPPGALVSRLASDAELVGQTLTQNLSDGLRSGVSVVAGSVMMALMSWQLAAISLFLVLPTAALAVFYGRFVRRLTKSVQDALAGSAAVAEERLSGWRTVRVFGAEPREAARYQDALDKVFALAVTEAKARAAFFGMAGLAGNSMVLAVLYCGGAMVSDASLTVGNLSAFLLYAAYIGISVGGLSSFYAELSRGLGASSRLWDLLDRSPAIPLQGGVYPASPPQGRVGFENVSFGYSDTPILTDFTLSLSPGGATAIVGASGSGKSTLAALLLRLYDVRSGRITLDGVDIRTLDPRYIRDFVTSVDQEPVLFAGTVRDNVCYGMPNPDAVPESEVMSALDEANCTDFVSRLDGGINAVVGNRGNTLSGGQKQRLALARALIKNPRVLVLDEATSALDAESERSVQAALQRASRQRTVLVIAHRLSTVRSAQQIAVLKDGSVAELGDFTTLLQRDGPFARLVGQQALAE